MGKFLVSLYELEKWFNSRKRVLPWRDLPSVYRVWISEIMLQQTQVVTVIPYFERFLERFPDVESLAKAPLEDVLYLWAGLGYYSRARNVHRAAQMIVKKGEFPKTRAEWLEIPGVGNYTAGAILSIAANEPEAILDGNVERVLSRVRKVTRAKGDAEFKKRLWRYSRAFVEVSNQKGIAPRDLNQALMELGALVCTPKNPKCGICPLKGICRALLDGNVESYPPKKKAKEWVKVDEIAHCVLSSERVLLRRRNVGEWRAGLWDLPTQLWANSSRGLKFLGKVESRHIVTRHKIHRTTQVWQVQEPQGWKIQESSPFESASREGLEPEVKGSFRWVSLSHPEVALGSAVKKTLSLICHEFNERVQD